MEGKATVVYLDWDGPYAIKDIRKKFGDMSKDRGIYQIYGTHPIYGNDVLLYIGKAVEQTFAVRIGQHGAGGFGYCDDERESIYIGRLYYNIDDFKKITVAEMKRHIDEAEKLLIYAHGPIWNTRHTSDLKGDIANLHVMNWSNHRMLMPEVSTARQVTLNCACENNDDWPEAKYDK